MLRRIIRRAVFRTLNEYYSVDSKETLEIASSPALHVAAIKIADRIYEDFEEYGFDPRLSQRIVDIQREQRMLSQQIIETRGAVLAAFEDQPERVCKLNQTGDGGNIGFIVKGGPSLQASIEGKKLSDKELRSWLVDAVEVVVIDPYLFKRNKPQNANETDAETIERDAAYADALLDVIGKNKSVDFIYQSTPKDGEGKTRKVSPGVANRIAERISAVDIKPTFHAVEDLHDRVWLKRDKRFAWSAKVVGTSRGSIGIRPTYIIDMSDDDCDEYREYVSYLIGVAQKSHDRPIDFKKKLIQNSHSGKEKRVKK